MFGRIFQLADGRQGAVSRVIAGAAFCATLTLSACQSSLTQRDAPTPVELYGGIVQPVSGPVLLRYRPAGAVQLAGSMSVKADVRSFHFDRRDSLSGRGTITSAGEGLIRVQVTFTAGSYELNQELDIEPFSLDLLMTDLGDIRNVDWHFAALDRLDRDHRNTVISIVTEMFPIISWPETAIQPDEPFSAINFRVLRGQTIMRETGDIQLRIDGETVFDGRPAYLIGFSGRAQSLSEDEAISGYYVVDAETGFVLEHRFTGRDKDYVQQYLVFRNFDVESRTRF